MIKTARHYKYLVVALLTLGVCAHYSFNAIHAEPVSWLCSGRYIDSGSIQYDTLLVVWSWLAAIGIAVAYFAIPGIIYRISKQRDDIDSKGRDVLQRFTGFILMCGVGHLLNAANIHLHYYYLAAAWHTATAIISIDTAINLARVAPYFINLPSRREFDQYRTVSENIQRSSSYGFWFFDPHTGAVKWSIGLYLIYGFKRSEPLSLEKIDALVHPDSRAHYLKETKDHREHGGDADFTYKIVVDGKTKVVRAGIFQDKENGTAYGYVRDLTATPLKADDIIDAAESLPDNLQASTVLSIATRLQNYVDSKRLNVLSNGRNNYAG